MTTGIHLLPKFQSLLEILLIGLLPCWAPPWRAFSWQAIFFLSLMVFLLVSCWATKLQGQKQTNTGCQVLVERKQKDIYSCISLSLSLRFRNGTWYYQLLQKPFNSCQHGKRPLYDDSFFLCNLLFVIFQMFISTWKINCGDFLGQNLPFFIPMVLLLLQVLSLHILSVVMSYFGMLVFVYLNYPFKFFDSFPYCNP